MHHKEGQECRRKKRLKKFGQAERSRIRSGTATQRRGRFIMSRLTSTRMKKTQCVKSHRPKLNYPKPTILKKRFQQLQK